MTGRTMRYGCASWFAAVLAGCAAVPSSTQIAAVQKRVDLARKADAYRCAPQELAIAQSQLEFARVELKLGDVERAQEHLGEAMLNAEGALSRSGEGCSAKPAVGEEAANAAVSRTDDRDGDGIADRVDLCPDEAEDMDGTVDRDGCPDLDNDNDGIPDLEDDCPNAAEDVDGFEDSDGCPEVDNDGDGVLDGDDRCPQARGTAAAEGCPVSDYPGAVLGEDSIELSVPLTFAERSTVLTASAGSILDVVGRMMHDRPSLTLQVAAHTDSRGDDVENQKLTVKQAEVVRQALIERGVSPGRLTANGYGETRPLESNRTSLGRSANRRIELVRTDVGP